MKKLLLYGLVFLLSLISAFSTVLLEEDFQGVSSCSSFFSNAVGTGTWTPQRVSGGQNDTYSCDASTGATSNARYTQFNWDMTSGSYNVSIWLYRNANDLDVRLASDGAYSNQFAVGYVDTVSLTNLVYLDGGGWVDSGVSFPATTWKRVDYIRDGNDISMYFDGSLIHTATRSSINMSYFYGFIRDPNDGRLDSFIACDTASSCYTTPSVSQEVFTIVAKEAYDNADIAEFKTNITFNSTTITAKTTNSSIVFNETYDFSGNNNTLTNNGATYVDGGFSFDGSNDYLSLPVASCPDSNNMTVIITSTFNEFSGFQELWSCKGTHNLEFRFNGVTLEFGLWNGASFTSLSNTTSLNTGQEYTFTLAKEGTSTEIYIDGTLIKSGTVTGTADTFTTYYLGDLSGSSFFLNGTIHNYKVWDQKLTSTQISAEQGETINYYDNLVTFYPFQRITNSTTANITTFKDDYLVSDTQTNYLTNTTLTAYLSQSQISLSATELITNASVNGNFTIGATTYGTNETINITAGDYNVTVSSAGYYPITEQITVNGGVSQSFNIGGLYNAILNLTFYDLETNNTIDSYNLDVVNSTYSESYVVSGESSYEVPVLQNLTYGLTFTKSGYFSTSFSTFPTTNYTNISTTVAEIGYIQINIYDLNTSNKMTTNVTLLVQNTTKEVIYEVANGTGSINSLNQGTQYNLQFSALGYETNNYVFTYTNQSIINLYMNQGQTDITFIAQDSASTPLQGVEVQIERFVNGTYQVISLGETDIIGTYIANLQTGLTHRITFTKDGYSTQSFITQLSETSYTVTMQTASIFDIAQGLDTIKTSYSPDNKTLYPTTVSFQVNITSDDFVLQYYYARLKFNGSVLVIDNNTDAQGGTLTFNYDVSAYNNSGLPLILEYGYLTNEGGLVVHYHAYSVSSDENYAGSLLELRDKMANKLTILEKLAIFAFVFIVLMLAFSTLVSGIINVIISAGLALLVGWLVGINLLILSVIFVLSIVIIMAWGNERI